jgi:hypothetical protein
VRAGYSSRTAALRKRRSHAYPEDSPAIDPPRSAGPMTSAEQAAQVAFLKNTRIGKASTCHARTCEQGGPQP